MEENSTNETRQNIIVNLPKPKKYPISWRLLLVSDHGRIVTIRKFKQLVAGILITLLISITAAVSFFFLYQNERFENENLKTSLTKYRQMAKLAQRGKEILATRLVVHGIDAEIAKENSSLSIAEKADEAAVEDNSNTGNSSDSEPANESKDGSGKKSKQSENEISENISSEQEKKNGKEAAILSDLVSVEQFKLSHDPAANILKAQFKLNNTSEDTVSGYMFVILKSREESTDSWLSLPSTQLTEGIPADYKSGRHFAISRFKTIRFKAENPQNPKQFDQAVVIIYGDEGDILFRKEFPVNT